MIVLRNKADVITSYPIETLANKEKVLFFDIETTGFSRKYCHVYLIGCMYYQEDTLMYTQWFAENKNEEANVLMAFYQFMKSFDTIIHFNGNSFDIPFVKIRGGKYNLQFDFDSFHIIDIYQSVSGMKHILKLENQKQKTFEHLLGIHRNDPFSGGELIDVYQEYIRTKDEKLLFPLLLHNKEDVFHMASLLSLLAISDFFDGKFNVEDFSVNQYHDLSGKEKQELKIILSLENALPIPISYHFEGIYVNAKEKRAQISVPVIYDTMKFFFDNYKDYYYLPVEDRSIHKSVASFVDSKYRKAATRSTCYEKLSGEFVPVFGKASDLYRCFRKEYSDKQLFIQLKSLSSDNIDMYATNLLNHFIMKSS